MIIIKWILLIAFFKYSQGTILMDLIGVSQGNQKVTTTTPFTPEPTTLVEVLFMFISKQLYLDFLLIT